MLTRRIALSGQPGAESSFVGAFIELAACLLLNGRYGELSMTEKGRNRSLIPGLKLDGFIRSAGGVSLTVGMCAGPS